ncbi:MAG: magnesium chelatase [Elainellaceae cyanobacterium]
MSKATADLSNPLIRGLACATLHPGLRSILVFDAGIATLQFAAHNLTWMLRQVTGCQVVPVQLGVVETEEDLWGGLALQQGDAKGSFEWQQGLLAGGRGQELRLVIIPDLTRLSLPAARACVALMGSEVAYLERHGHRDSWQPKLCWLAGCSRSEIGLVSPHLLDRFALRLAGQDLVTSDRAQAIQKWLKESDKQDKKKDALPPEWVSTLRKEELFHPEITLEAQKRVLDYISPTDSYSVRRELALLWLAQANAQLAEASQVTAQQVDRAAQMIGLTLIKPNLDIDSRKPEQPIQPELPPDPNSPIGKTGAEDQILMKERATAPVQEPVYASDTTETLPSQPIQMDSAIANPYPEDTTPVQREAASLRLPIRRFKNVVLGRGAIVGVEPATTPQDLAIVSTLLEAAKYQQIRQTALLERHGSPGSLVEFGSEANLNGERFSYEAVSRSLILQPIDLRRYRRAVVPEQMLALVLDYTCLQECKWQESLLPYWQWAYEERASVCLIQVGAANASHELQAEKITADKILVPRIRLGLGAGRGRATPLAHGLDLVLQSLRHALQHGRSAIRQAVLVVVTDGRGNVPLEASRIGRITPPVGQQGIEDALQVAQQIAGLKEVKSVVLNPQPKHYRDLPVKLAQALGARIAEIPPLKVWEVEE